MQITFLSDVGLYNMLAVFLEFHLLDKANKDKAPKVHPVSNVYLNYQSKGSDTVTRYY